MSNGCWQPTRTGVDRSIGAMRASAHARDWTCVVPTCDAWTCRTFHSNIILFDEKRIGPWLADVRWGDVDLAVVRWSQMKMLGEEYQARQRKQAGKPKDAATRLNEYETAVRANRQLATVLAAQGLNEEAAHFAYHAQKLQRVVCRRRKKLGL